MVHFLLIQVVIKTVDVSYGGENGFNQAIELSAETLGNVKLVQEKKLIQKVWRLLGFALCSNSRPSIRVVL